MDDFTNKLLFDQSKISLTTKIRFKLVWKIAIEVWNADGLTAYRNY